MMWLFGKKKKPAVQKNRQPEPKPEQLEDGDLPFGWVARNKAFTSMIESEYTYFLNNWIDSRQKEPLRQYEALKSFVLYMEDVKKRCRSKGECFEFWCNEILISTEYLEKRKSELNELQTNFDSIDRDYKKKQHELKGLEERVENKLKENDGILQSEFIKLFDPIVKNEVSHILYNLANDGKINRTKEGRSYILHIQKKD